MSKEDFVLGGNTDRPGADFRWVVTQMADFTDAAVVSAIKDIDADAGSPTAGIALHYIGSEAVGQIAFE